VPGAVSLLARCPVDLAANAWYERRGFTMAGCEESKSGRKINVWKLRLESSSLPLPLLQS